MNDSKYKPYEIGDLVEQTYDHSDGAQARLIYFSEARGEWVVERTHGRESGSLKWWKEAYFKCVEEGNEK